MLTASAASSALLIDHIGLPLAWTVSSDEKPEEMLCQCSAYLEHYTPYELKQLCNQTITSSFKDTNSSTFHDDDQAIIRRFCFEASLAFQTLHKLSNIHDQLRVPCLIKHKSPGLWWFIAKWPVSFPHKLISSHVNFGGRSTVFSFISSLSQCKAHSLRNTFSHHFQVLEDTGDMIGSSTRICYLCAICARLHICWPSISPNFNTQFQRSAMLRNECNHA